MQPLEKEPARTTKAKRQDLGGAYLTGPVAHLTESERTTGSGRGSAVESRLPEKESSTHTGADHGAAEPVELREEMGGNVLDGPWEGDLDLKGPLPVPNDARLRLPSFADLRRLYTSRRSRSFRRAIRQRVRRALIRMRRDKKPRALKVRDKVSTIMARLFPRGRALDEAEFKRIVDPTVRRQVYGSVLRSRVRVHAADRPKVRVALLAASSFATACASRVKDLKQVFGRKRQRAKKVYGLIAAKLIFVHGNLDKVLTTDYNLDLEEMRFGGWAMASPPKLHLLERFVRVKNPSKTTIVMIHEGAHLADAVIGDTAGYYKKPGFEAKSEAAKVKNAAHYEEVPRRLLGMSRFPGHTFRRNVYFGGRRRASRRDRVRSYGIDYFRRARRTAAHMHMLLVDMRKKALAGSLTLTRVQRRRLRRASRALGLTFHLQKSSSATVTQLDLVLVEGLARGIYWHKDKAKTFRVRRRRGAIRRQGIRFARDVVRSDRAILGKRGWRIVRWLRKREGKTLP